MITAEDDHGPLQRAHRDGSGSQVPNHEDIYMSTGITCACWRILVIVDPLRFLILVYFFTVSLLITATFYVLLFYVGMCSVCWLFWLRCQYANLLARKIPLRKPNCGEGVVSTNHRPKSVYDFLGLVYSFSICLLSPGPIRDTFHIPMARYRLFLLKVPLNAKQLSNSWNGRSKHVI